MGREAKQIISDSSYWREISGPVFVDKVPITVDWKESPYCVSIKMNVSGQQENGRVRSGRRGILKVAGQRRKQGGRREVTFKDSSLTEEEMEPESALFFSFPFCQTENEKLLSGLVGQPTFSDTVPENSGLVRGTDTGSTGSTESGEAAYGPNTNDSSTWMVSAASSSSCPVSELMISSQLQTIMADNFLEEKGRLF